MVWVLGVTLRIWVGVGSGGSKIWESGVGLALDERRIGVGCWY